MRVEPERDSDVGASEKRNTFVYVYVPREMPRTSNGGIFRLIVYAPAAHSTGELSPSRWRTYYLFRLRRRFPWMVMVHIPMGHRSQLQCVLFDLAESLPIYASETLTDYELYLNRLAKGWLCGRKVVSLPFWIAFVDTPKYSAQDNSDVTLKRA